MGKKTIHGGLIIRGTLASGAGDDLLTIDATTGEVGKISGTPLTTTLTAGSIFVGDGSNVATATAVTGDVTINSSGVTAIASGVIVNDDINASAAIAHSKMAALTASRALVSDGSGVVSVSAVSSTALGYVANLSSDAQTQLNAKQATITGGATTITSADLAANRALLSNASGKVAVSTVTNTELGYVSGVTSAIQTQFSGKLSATIAGAATGDIIYYNGSAWVNLPRGANGETLQSTGSSIEWASATANGIASGGTDGQVLTKQSGTDYDADWESITVASITDLTASAAELNLLDGVTATTTEINYIDGVTSNIQSQLGNKLSTALPHHAIFVGNVSNIASSLAAGSEGQVLSISSGTPSWTTISSSGVTTIAAIDGTTKSANGAAISGANLYLQTADATYPGAVSLTTQTFAGVKTFNERIIANGTLDEPAVVIAGTGSNNHQFNGIGRDGSGHTTYQSIDNTYNHIWRAGTSASTSDDLMKLNGDGTFYLPAATSTVIPYFATSGELITTDTRLIWDELAERMTVDGSLGVGTTPTRTLHATALTAATNTVTQVLRLTSTSTGSPAAGIGVGIEFETEVTSGNIIGNRIESVATDVGGSADFDFRFYNMQAGSGAAETFRITSVGNATLVGTGTATDWVATSDRRVKSNISRVQSDVLSEISKIGDLFSSYEKGGKAERGFIAQELLEVAPEYVIVPKDSEQMMAVNYSKMTALLFKGIQQLLEK